MIATHELHREQPIDSDGDSGFPAQLDFAEAASPPPSGSPPRYRLWHKIVVGVGSVVIVGLGIIAIDNAMNDSHHATRSFNGPVTVLDINVDSGSVRVVGGTDSTITVDVTSHGGLRRPDHAETLIDGRLRIRSTCRFDLVSPTCAADYVVHVPANVKVIVGADGADIDLVGTTGDVDMTLNGGDVNMQFASAPHSVAVDANGGDIVIEVPNDVATYDVDAETNGGATHVGVRTDPESPNHIDIEANGGDIRVRYAEDQRVGG
jgi:Putative adhesin